MKRSSYLLPCSLAVSLLQGLTGIITPPPTHPIITNRVITAHPGYNFLSNPLLTGESTIDDLFGDLPIGSQVSIYSNGVYLTATLDDFTCQ